MRKAVLITGGSRGIGEGIVRKFYENGWDVAFFYRKSEARAKALCEELPGVLAFRCDVAEEEQVTACVSAAEAAFGHLDALVCNAGVAQYGLFTDVSGQEFDRVFDTNVRGAFFCCRAVLPGMIHRKSGSIITLSSIWGETGASCEVIYSASKGAVIAMTKALAKEVGPSGIRVNSVSPGTIVTDMVKNLGDETLEALRQDTPLELLGTPDMVADAVYFLASDNARFITGQVLGVNGGYLI